MSFETTAVSATADEFDLTDSAVPYRCLWAEQGVGVFAYQQNKNYSVALVTLRDEGRGYQPVQVHVLAFYTVRSRQLESLAAAMKKMGQTVLTMKAEQWTFSGGHCSYLGMDVSASHQASSRQIAKNTMPVGSFWGVLAVKKMNFILQRALKESSVKLAVKRIDRLDSLQNKLSGEKLSFIHLALRMYPETDSNTLEIIAIQAQSLAETQNLDMVASLEAASKQILCYPALKAG